jgi:hypothetical protein
VQDTCKLALVAARFRRNQSPRELVFQILNSRYRGSNRYAFTHRFARGNAWRTLLFLVGTPSCRRCARHLLVGSPAIRNYAGANLPTLGLHVVDRGFCHLRCRGEQLAKFPSRLWLNLCVVEWADSVWVIVVVLPGYVPLARGLIPPEIILAAANLTTVARKSIATDAEACDCGPDSIDTF